MDTIRAFFEHLLPPMLVILTGVLTVLGHAAIRWLSRRFDVEDVVRGLELDRRWADIVDHGIARAEAAGMAWAQEHGELMPGAKKMDEALAWAVREAKRRGLPTMARDELKELIEARLGMHDTPGELVGGMDAQRDLEAARRAGAGA